MSHFIHPLATVIGNVTFGERASVWPGAVVRGDSEAIVIGAESNVQDGAIIHVDPGLPAVIGARVAIAHRAVIHGCTIEDDCLIGMGAILLNRVHVGTGSVVAAGAVCAEGMQIPPNSLVLGVPARVRATTSPDQRARISHAVAAYLALQEAYRRGDHPLHQPTRLP